MEGRLESKIKFENRIENLLNSMPDYCQRYYYNISASKEIKTCYMYIFMVYKLYSFYNKKDLLSLTEMDMAKFFKSLETKEVNGEIKSASFSLWKQYYAGLNSFYKYFVKSGVIAKNPIDNIECIRKKDKVEHIFLSQEELKKLLETVKVYYKQYGNKKHSDWTTRDLAIVMTFITTGMRETALSEMDMNRVDLNNNILTVTDKEHKENTYTISKELKEIYLKWLQERSVILKGKDSDAFFISEFKRRISANSLRELIYKYTEIALGKKVSPHKLRAAYANILLKQTNDIYFVSKAMKHANVSTTQIYLQSNEKEINDKVADIMSDMF